MKKIINKVCCVGWCLSIVGLNWCEVKASAEIDYCFIESPYEVSTDYQFADLLNEKYDCALVDGSIVEVTIEWQLIQASEEEFNTQLGSFDVVANSVSDESYSLAEPLHIEIIKEGYTIQADEGVTIGSDLAVLLASTSSAYVKVLTVPSDRELSQAMFNNNLIEVLDLSELSLTSLGSHLFSGLTSLKKVVLPPTINRFEGVVSDCPIEVMVKTKGNIDYSGDSSLEQSFFSVIDFKVLESLKELSLKGYMSNEISSDLEVIESYRSGDTYLSYDYLSGFEFNSENQSGMSLNHRVSFNQQVPSHMKEGIVRYYGEGRKTYVDQGISFAADFSKDEEGVVVSYTLNNVSDSTVSDLYFSVEGTLKENPNIIFELVKTEKGIKAVNNLLGVQLSVNALTPVNSVWIGNKTTLNDNIHSNTYVNKENSAFSMTWKLDTLAASESQSFLVLYQVEPIVHSEPSTTNQPYSGWLVKDLDNKLIKRMSHFNKEYDQNYHIYYQEKGKLVKGWKLIEIEWYYFNQEGLCLMRGWIAASDDWYYIDNYSVVCNRWIATTHGRWYYQNQEGKMVRSQNVEGYFVNKDGIYWGIASDKKYINSYVANY